MHLVLTRILYLLKSSRLLNPGLPEADPSTLTWLLPQLQYMGLLITHVHVALNSFVCLHHKRDVPSLETLPINWGDSAT